MGAASTLSGRCRRRRKSWRSRGVSAAKVTRGEVSHITEAQEARRSFTVPVPCLIRLPRTLPGGNGSPPLCPMSSLLAAQIALSESSRLQCAHRATNAHGAQRRLSLTEPLPPPGSCNRL